MRKVFALILLTIFVYSCGDNGTNPTVDTSVLMPLKIGNTWTYDNFVYYNPQNIDSSSTTMFLDSLTQINGENYYSMKMRDVETNEIYMSPIYYLNKQDGLHIFVDIENEEWSIFLKYPTFKGEIINQNGTTNIVVEDTEYLVATPAGTFKCIKYVQSTKFDNVEIAKSINYFAPGIGQVLNEFYDINSRSGISTLFTKRILKSYKLN